MGTKGYSAAADHHVSNQSDCVAKVTAERL